MYVVKITRLIKARGKRPEEAYKFIGELTEEVRKQWEKIYSHAEAGIRYELMTFAEYDRYLKQKEFEEQQEKAEKERKKKEKENKKQEKGKRKNDLQ